MLGRSPDTIIYNVRIFLNRGDEVPLNETGPEREIPEDRIRHENGLILIDHISTLGKRQAMAGIEKTLIGMRAGGFRKIRIGPHLAYGSRGVPGLIPADAALNVSVWLREIIA